MHDVECSGCGESFKAARRSARWCSDRCRKAARRKQDTVETPIEADTETADTTLVASVREELERHNAIGSFPGQLALQLARKVSAVDATGVAGLSKELRTVMAEAIGAAAVPGDPSAVPADEVDEVEKARRRREKAREAAGLS